MGKMRATNHLLLFTSFLIVIFVSSEEQLDEEIIKILDRIKNLEKDIENIDNFKKEALNGIEINDNAVNEMLNRQPAIIQIRESLNDAASKGKDPKECKEMLERAMHTIILDFKKKLLSAASLRLELFELNLRGITQKLEHIKRNISKNKETKKVERDLNEIKKTITSKRSIPSNILKSVMSEIESEYASDEMNSKLKQVDLCLRERNL